jgi:hypothetical protein
MGDGLAAFPLGTAIKTCSQVAFEPAWFERAGCGQHAIKNFKNSEPGQPATETVRANARFECSVWVWRRGPHSGLRL